jgi:hypothetical protein
MTCVFFDLDDARLSQMAQAWPHLQVLDLQSPVSGVADTDVTLGGILPVLKYCPELRELALTVDGTGYLCADPQCKSHPERPWQGISNHNITTLTVGNSAIDSAEGVAQFLSHILPNLREIVSWEYQSEQINEFGGMADEDIFWMRDCQSEWEDVVPMMQNAGRILEKDGVGKFKPGVCSGQHQGQRRGQA